MPKLNQIRRSGCASRRLPAWLLEYLLTLCPLVVLLAACTVPPASVPAFGTTAQPAALPASAGILDGSVQPTTFDQVKAAIDQLYRSHPDINSYAVKGVTYTPETRDKVLKICHEGGLVANEAERESQEVLACAPLIFFFYRYGQESSVPESTEVARKMYWYTVSNHSSQSKEVLTQLLRGWGIN